jgi:L-fucose isomerase-like protein
MAKGAFWTVLLRLTDRSIGMVSTLFLARLLAPADFGLIAMAMSIVAMLEVISTFSFDIALIQNPTAERRHYDTAWTFNVLFGLANACLLLALAGPVATFYAEPRSQNIMMWLALYPALQGFGNIGIVAFQKDLEHFASVCRVTNGLRNARIGAIGTRPAAFQTMRCSEKLLQASGITVIPVDLSEIMAAANKIDVTSSRAISKLAEIKGYGSVAPGIKNLGPKFEKHLRLFLASEDWMQSNAIDAAGFQCWTSIQQNYGCATCLTMSMMSDQLIPCACEVDVAGVTAMYALVLATGNPAAIVDWNNNYADDRNKCVAQHCGNYPKGFVGKPVQISNLSVLGSVLGEELCFGGIDAKVEPGPMTYLRFSTDDINGRIRGYVGEGEFTADPFNMLGSIAVCQVPNLQKLMKFICKQGFEHHVSMVRSKCASAITEAATTYLGWDMHVHE